MNAAAPQVILGIFMIFCRIGGCLLIMPGFSSFRVPPQIRLFIAIALTFALSPILLEQIQPRLAGQSPATMLWWIISESLTGLLIGLLGRIFFFALETLLMAVSSGIGVGSIPGTPVEGTEAMPAINSIIMMVATVLLFLADLHWELVRGLVASYARITPGEGIGTQLALIQVVDQITKAFVLSLRIASPFIVYSVIVNLAVGITNKLTPQIPVYFIATPFVLFGGLLLLYLLFTEFMTQFITEFTVWLSQG